MTDAITPENEGRFSGVLAFKQTVVATLTSACAAGAKELWLVDPDFAEWPLDDRALLDAMTVWARVRSRTLRMLARQYDEVPRRHPRFTAWRRSFAHVVDCRAAPEVDVSEFPVLVLAQPPGVAVSTGVQGGAAPNFRGHVLSQDAEWRTWREIVDAISQRSEPAFPAHSLGL